MAGPNQVFACTLLEQLGFGEGEPGVPGRPGSGARFPITNDVVENLKKLVGKSVLVADSGDTTIE